MQANIFKITTASVQNGPGQRTVIYFKGCPLRCSWCSNPQTATHPTQILWDSKRCLFCRLCATHCPTGSLNFLYNKLQFHAETCTACRECVTHCPSRMLHFVGQMMDLEEVMDIILTHRENGLADGGVTLSGGDPMMQPKFTAELLRRCHAQGIHTVIETTGYAGSLDFSRVSAHTDLMYLELKHYDEHKHVQFTGASNQTILANLDFALLMKLPLIVRISIIPGINNGLSDARKFGELLSQHHVTDVELLHYHQMGQRKYEEFHLPSALSEACSSGLTNLADYANVIREYGINVLVPV